MKTPSYIEEEIKKIREAYPNGIVIETGKDEYQTYVADILSNIEDLVRKSFLEVRRKAAREVLDIFQEMHGRPEEFEEFQSKVANDFMTI